MKMWLLKVVLVLCVVLFSGMNIAAEPRTLIARGDHYYPPFEYLDENGEAAGFNVDLFKAVANVMGLNAEISLGPWTEVRAELEEGKIDLLIGMFYSLSRDLKVDFSTPHSMISHAIFVPSASSISSVADLRNKDILVQHGDIVHDYLLENRISDHLIPVTDQERALQLLNEGYYDAAFVTKYQGLYFLEQHNLKNIKMIDDSFIPQRYCFAVQEGDTELTAILNEGLNILKLNGTYARIYDKWFGVLEEHNALRGLRQFFLIIGFIVVSLLLLLLAFILSLRVSVRKKTEHLNHEINQRRAAQEELEDSTHRLKESLKEKNVLLSEIHHRVKNNLQIIHSLLELQRSTISDPTLDGAILTSQQRIASMALIHEQLYSTEEFSEINLKDYAEDLVGSIIRAYHGRLDRISLVQEVVPAGISMDKAIPLGLIITELLTNSLKHAFPDDRSGTVSITVSPETGGKLSLIVEDDGIGFTPGEEGHNSLGHKLVATLIEQLNGSLELSFQGGTRYVLRFPVAYTLL